MFRKLSEVGHQYRSNVRVGNNLLVFDPIGAIFSCASAEISIVQLGDSTGISQFNSPSIISDVSMQKHCEMEGGVEVRNLAACTCCKSPTDTLNPVGGII